VIEPGCETVTVRLSLRTRGRTLIIGGVRLPLVCTGVDVVMWRTSGSERIAVAVADVAEIELDDDPGDFW
jgi:hypothetical protein